MNKIKQEILPKEFEPRDLVGLSWDALNKLFKSLKGRNIKIADLKQWKLVLGFTNATNHAITTSMQCFKLSSLPQAIGMLKKVVKRRKY